MIAPLRRTHRRTFAALALVLPAMLFAGLAARRPEPAAATSMELASTVLSAGGAFAFRLHPDGHLEAETRELHPDPLFFWSAEPPGPTLPAGARVLGPPGASYALPQQGGFVILYSGGHRRLVDFAPLGVRP